MKKQTADFQVTPNVPIPANTRNKCPFRSMKIGSSFFAPWVNGKPLATIAAFAFHRTNREYSFTTRTLMENGIKGVRIWRIAAKKK
jgi:hypothetical protein